LPVDDEQFSQYRKRTEKVLKKVIVGVVIMTVFIIVSSFFV